MKTKKNENDKKEKMNSYSGTLSKPWKKEGRRS